jgi:SAM-dependent methyltransferase
MPDERRRLQQVVDAVFAGKQSPTVLDAGCGFRCRVRFPPDTHIVGLDISQDQLDKNEDIDEKLLGDIQSHELPHQHFDGIVCWNVLEHLQKPENALEQFNRAIRDGGIIILSAPNPLSAKGIVTKLTPFVFHLWFYRNIRGSKDAGMNGKPPFPHYLRLSMTPNAIKEFAERNGFTILHDRVAGYGDSRDVLGRKSRRVDIIMKVINLFLRVVSFGTIKPELTQYYFILQKNPPQTAGEEPCTFQAGTTAPLDTLSKPTNCFVPPEKPDIQEKSSD